MVRCSRVKETKILNDELASKIKEFIDSLPFYVLLVDEEHHIVLANKVLEDQTDMEDLLGKYCPKVIHNLNGPYPGCPLEEAVKKRCAIEREFFEPKTNSWINSAIYPSNYITQDGRKVYIHFVYDITDKKRAEEELIKFNELLKLINKILRHDVLNNLNVVSGVLELIDTKDKELLNTAFKAIERSVKLIKDMMALESIRSSDQDLEAYDVRSVIEEVIESYSVDFRVEGDCTVMADEALSSVFDNIIRNAVVHGKTNRIDIKIERKGDVCEIRIADHGVGIPDEIKYKIFEDGFKYGETGHSGLGLYIVKKTIDRYGGSIHVEDNEPKGAVFTIVMKAAKCD
jgi:PAS domain S-box-containing protein